MEFGGLRASGEALAIGEHSRHPLTETLPEAELPDFAVRAEKLPPRAPRGIVKECPSLPCCGYSPTHPLLRWPG